MSANLDLVRSIHATWERADFSSAEWATYAAHTSGANVFHATADKVTRLVIYWDWSRALTDLGLED
jgi:hypothetical protein